jgi:peroxisomal membrane protein 2
MKGVQGFGILRRIFIRPSLPQLKSLSTNSTPPVKGSGMWNAYLKALEKRPILVKAVTSGFLAFSADVICQLYSPHKDQLRKLKEKHQQESAEGNGNPAAETEFSLHELQLRLSIIDKKRLSIFTFLGVAYIGPCLHFWYGFLMRAISGVSARATLTRVMLDQSVFAPTFLAGLFANGLLLEGRPQAIEAKIRNDLPQTVLMNWSVWIPSMLVMFRFCPAHLQVLFSNSIGFFWNIYLTWKLNADGETGDALAPVAAEK